jgi:hypothetical protein
MHGVHVEHADWLWFHAQGVTNSAWPWALTRLASSTFPATSRSASHAPPANATAHILFSEHFLHSSQSLVRLAKVRQKPPHIRFRAGEHMLAPVRPPGNSIC